ncbi:MAG: hypothetical protein GX573_24055, partial [Chloroflexi bacterium]|nr:hypothetical protein [Chloroflexota bacterium]
MYSMKNKWQTWRNLVRIIFLLLTLSLLILLLPATLNVQAQSNMIHFQGPETTHTSYIYYYSVDYGEVEFSVVEPSSERRVIARTEGENPALSGQYHDQGLIPGQYLYQIRIREFNVDTEEWGPWGVVQQQSVDIDGRSAIGTMLFDDSIANAVIVGEVTVPTGTTLTASGTMTTSSGTLRVYGTLNVSGVLEIPPVTGVPGSRYCASPCVNTFVYSENHLTNVTGGAFYVYEGGQGSSFTDCNDTYLRLYTGVTLNNVQNTSFMQGETPNDQVLRINDSTVIFPQDHCLTGQIVFDRSVVSGDSHPIVFRSECSVQANATIFNNEVQLGDPFHDDALEEDLYFHSQDSRFIGLLRVVMAAPGNVSFVDSLFSGFDFGTSVSILGGYPTFTSCEFGGHVDMYRRNGATFENNLFLGQLRFEDSGVSNDASPYWREGDSPSPTIQNNAFMGESAFAFSAVGPSSPVPVGRNYYGDSAGYYYAPSGSGLKHGFLGYHSGHTGAYNLAYHEKLTITHHLETSPISGARRDTRVLPRIWVNSYIVGQNTIAHDGTLGPLLKGRDTLLSAHMVASEDNVQGVRVYAVWNGQVIEAANNRSNRPLHRNHSLYDTKDIRNGNATYNFILPGVDNDSPGEDLNMPVDVYQDVSGVPGYDAEAYPETDYLLFSKQLSFTDPPARPLRIAVQPVEILGLFGSSWGVSSPAGVMQILRTDLSDLLPIPADSVDIVRLPTRTFWSPSSSITPAGLMSRIAAGVGLARAWTGVQSAYAPDFLVVVLPQSFVGENFDGAAYAWSSRILFVAEHKPDAVLHELGHGIGLYTGIWNEQYQKYPPYGLPVEHATRFHTETPGRRRFEHLPGPSDFWYDLSANEAFYYMDIMGCIGPLWTRPETVQSFHNWFQGNLVNAQSTNWATMPSASDTRRILISGAVDPGEPDGETLIPETISSFDVTGLEFPDMSPTASYDYWYAHRLRAFDAEGAQIYNDMFTLTQGEKVFVATFDLPTTTASFCIERVVGQTPIHCAHLVGLQATQLLNPQPGDEIGALFEASWATQATESVTESQLLHALFYKTAPDGPWQFGLMTQGTEIATPSSFLPDTDYLALRLLSSDGLTHVEHVVEGLTVSPRPPQVTILSPLDGDQSEAGIAWQLAASAEDFGGAGLQPGQWRSSVDGDLGEGTSIWSVLSVGAHTLRYQVEDN